MSPISAEFFTHAVIDSIFYQDHVRGARDRDVRLHRIEPPRDWMISQWDGWESWTPPQVFLPLQGWKIHISATLDSASETLRRTIDVCIENNASFKFRYLKNDLLEINSKGASRSSSGKFITIYPENCRALAEILDSLEERLADQPGPQILSDIRFKNGPIFVRYGGFIPFSSTDDDDQPIRSVIEPSTMRVVADRVGPIFSLPEWVDIPDCLRESVGKYEEHAPSPLDDFTRLSPLHYSNSGGVYRATRKDGSVCLLREARRYAGLDARGRDSIERQIQEEMVLRELNGVTGVQKVRRSFEVLDHRFLELDYTEGVTLTAWVSNNYLESFGESTLRSQYAHSVVGYLRSAAKIVVEIHSRGWAMGDFHPGNIIVNPIMGDVTLIDFEDSVRLDTRERRVALRVADYAPPDILTAQEADWFALSRIALAVFVPNWQSVILAPAAWPRILSRVEGLFGRAAVEVIREFESECGIHLNGSGSWHPLSPVKCAIRLEPNESPSVLADSIRDLVGGIERGIEINGGVLPRTVTKAPERSLNIATGVAGWLLLRERLHLSSDASLLSTLRTAGANWPMVWSPGMFTGLGGIALVLAEANDETAVIAAHSALDIAMLRKCNDLYSGRAGAIYCALKVGRKMNDWSLVSRAIEHAQFLRSEYPIRRDQDEKYRAGLFYGHSGIGLLYANLFQVTRDNSDRAYSLMLMRQDIANLVWSRDKRELVAHDRGNGKVLPYLGFGSSGVLAALGIGGEMLAENIVEEVLSPEQFEGLLFACRQGFYAYSGLSRGRSGMLAGLLAVRSVCHGKVGEELIVAHVDGILGDLFRYQNYLFVPGEGRIRASSDYETGAIGVCLSLASSASGNPGLWMP